ncbi:hypothetical protein PTKIN_Ptkin18bG0031400 [Pterospermum kingtungense]
MVDVLAISVCDLIGKSLHLKMQRSLKKSVSMVHIFGENMLGDSSGESNGYDLTCSTWLMIRATTDLSMVPSTVSAVGVQAPTEKGFASFAIDFLMGGVSNAVSKTATAPIERVKLLIQNQDEMIKSGRLSEPYKDLKNQMT